MLWKQPRHRIFSYTPRYAKLERRERMKFERKTLFSARRGKHPLYYLLLLIAFILIYLYLKGYTGSSVSKTVPLSEKDAVVVEKSKSNP